MSDDRAAAEATDYAPHGAPAVRLRPAQDDPRIPEHAHVHEARSISHADAHVHEARSISHADAHAHADDPRPRYSDAGSFPHDKLAEHIPRGHRSIADHLQRAASNTVLLLAEGANRRGAAMKRQRFVESRGECGEVAAAADLLRVLAIGSPQDGEHLKQLASRVSAMLTRLIARQL